MDGDDVAIGQGERAGASSEVGVGGNLSDDHSRRDGSVVNRVGLDKIDTRSAGGRSHGEAGERRQIGVGECQMQSEHLDQDAGRPADVVDSEPVAPPLSSVDHERRLIIETGSRLLSITVQRLVNGVSWTSTI